ncbi:hypothetical protein CBS101457_003937 [Exobasidium rhododendri]|nr:hypothetical protein CBS101457_003937 [Exobasidium rhododendri]
MPSGSYGHFPRRNTGKPSDDANEDEEELLEWDLPTTRDTVLWLIDAGTKMHDQMVPLSEGREGDMGNDVNNSENHGSAIPKVSLFHKALQAAYMFQRSKLVNSPADHCGILLFNTEKTDVLEAGKNVAYPNSITIQTINQVAVPPISEIKDDLQNSIDNGPSYFREKYKPNAKQSRIHHALGNAEAMMLASGKAGSKRIFYVTNEDDPMGDKKGKAEQQRLALEKVKSMTKRGIEFEPFLVSGEDHTFETVHFYGDLFCAYAEENNETSGEPEDRIEAANYNHKTWNATVKFNHLEQEIGTRETPKRVIFSVPMTLGSEMTIGVKGYCTIVKANKGLPVRVMAMEREDEDDPIVYKEVITETTLNCADTGRELDKDRDVEHAFTFGTENNLRSKVRFSQHEMQKLRTFGQEPSIKIMGFKPLRELHFHENIKHAYFIYPSDLPYPNSIRAFSALLKSMARKKRMAIALFSARRNVIPTFAALLPQLEERGADGQIEPPGMYVIPLPYADDIREAPEKHRDQLQANEEQIEQAGKVVRAFSRNAAFNPDFFPNAGLNHHYQVLLAVAFNDDVPTQVQDKTLPNYAQIMKRTGHLISEWNDIVADDARIRKLVTQDVMTSSKKRPADFANDDEPDLKRKHIDGMIGKLVVDKLKAACDYYRLPKSGKKSELVDRLDEHLTKMLEKDEK